MIINLDNLNAGLLWWDKTNWGKDIGNAEYSQIYGDRSAGATKEWWTSTVDRLSQWRALRPCRKDEITALGADRLSAISDQYRELVEKSAGAEPNIADLCWEDVDSLFALASKSKPRKSPVFPSKMCHFLFPKLFIPMDNVATGLPLSYELWWRGMKDEWCRFKDKDEAITILEKAIRSDKSDTHIHKLYPFETKIMELSQIGHYHG